MAVGMPGHGDFETALLMIPNGFIVTLWAPTAYIHPEVERLVRLAVAVAWQFCALRE